MEAAPTKLLEYLRAWQVIPANTYPVDVRARSSAANDWWTPSTDAVACLVDTERLIELAGDDELCRSYEAIRVQVRDATFSSRWQLDATVNGDRSTLEPVVMAALGAIVSGLTVRDKILAASPGAVELRDTLLRVREEIMSAHLPEEACQYLLVLVGHLEQALAEVAVRGLADVQACADQLIGALTRLYPQCDGEESDQSPKVVKLLVRKIGDFLNSPLVAAIAGGVAGGVMGQITTG